MTGRRWFWNQCWWMGGNYHRPPSDPSFPADPSVLPSDLPEVPLPAPSKQPVGVP
jgi:hypothetical protein